MYEAEGNDRKGDRLKKIDLMNEEQNLHAGQAGKKSEDRVQNSEINTESRFLN